MAKRGNPNLKPHEPTDDMRRLVMTLTGFGITQEEIAREIGIDPTCLRKYYRRELDTGRTKAIAKVAGALFKNCMDGNVAAQIFWMKTQAQWRETAPDQNHHHEGSVDHTFTLRVFDGGKQVTPLTRDPPKLLNGNGKIQE